MKIELHEIKIRDIFQGYIDSDDEGVYGFNGKLNIRPKYQREFVYDDEKRKAVIDTINKGFPLNVMYWVKNSDGSFEVLDGQQRTISFCQYLDSVFSVENRFFHNLTENEKNKILEYKCMIYICEGPEEEKLAWFKIINIAGEKLTNQELRNALYTGEWLTDAKRHFSKSNCAGYNMSKNYINVDYRRQGLLELALKWICDSQNISEIEKYMSLHQLDKNCNELWFYFTSVINWVSTIFPSNDSLMKGLPWGEFYNKYKVNSYDANSLKAEIKKLKLDDEVTNKKGIYEYLLSRNNKSLNLRSFTDAQKIQMFESQNGICTCCKEKFSIDQMEADHIVPWSDGGKTEISNGQMLCKHCNRIKSNK